MTCCGALAGAGAAAVAAGVFSFPFLLELPFASATRLDDESPASPLFPLEETETVTGGVDAPLLLLPFSFGRLLPEEEEEAVAFNVEAACPFTRSSELPPLLACPPTDESEW